MIKPLILALAFSTASLVASAQVMQSAPAGFQRLYSTGVSVGNGADLTEDTLQTYTLPAGALANVGDTVHIIAAGQYIGSTDTKTARVKFGGLTVPASGTVAGQVRWWSDLLVTKTGASTQSVATMSGTSASGGVTVISQATAVTDTAAISIVVTGQNTTNSVSSSVTCQLLIVNFERGS